MIDPANITNYKMTDAELEEFAVFSVCVAGKTAKTIAAALDRIFGSLEWNMGWSPFNSLKNAWYEGGLLELESLLKKNGIGCYTSKAKTLKQLIFSNLNLRICSPKQLEEIYGIGFKTSRFFVMHSREGCRHAALDTHILRWLRNQGVEAPKNTPGSKKQYERLEKEFLQRVPADKSPAEFDLEIWNEYSK